MLLAAEFGTGQVFWSLLWFTLFFIWIWILIAVFADLFRSHDLGGWGKAFWCIFIILLPYLGVFVYLIARGSKMSQHAMEDAQRHDEMFRSYVQDAAGGAGGAAEIEKLVALKDKGAISDDEFKKMKAKITG